MHDVAVYINLDIPIADIVFCVVGRLTGCVLIAIGAEAVISISFLPALERGPRVRYGAVIDNPLIGEGRKVETATFAVQNKFR